MFNDALDSYWLTRRSLLMAVAAFPLVSTAKVQVHTDYRVTLLGDIHYDGTDPMTYHAKAFELGKVRDEFERNATMWKSMLPCALKASASLITDKTAFVLQLGDLIQGDTYDPEIHRTMLSDARHVLHKTYPKTPIVTVCGNHDIRAGLKKGIGEAVYREFFTQWMSESLKCTVQSTTFGVMLGEDLWIFIDFNEDANLLKSVKSIMKAHPKSRYTFVASHGAILPMVLGKHRWFTLGAPIRDDERRELRQLLASRQAICLTGHSHTVEWRDWFSDKGRITEFVANSVALGHSKKGGFAPYPNIIKKVHFKPEEYGKWALNGEKPPKVNLSNEARKSTLHMRELYEEYRPGIKHYEAGRGFGHYVLRVSDASVYIDYYGHDALVPTETFKLR